jgi:ATPase subunit of ABC transporter with duplicated ATPase domains
MSYKPISLNNLSLEFPHKTCFTDFSVTINYGDHIAIIGRNGSGKSSLLNMLRVKSSDIIIGYVPQIIEEFGSSSGGQRFNSALTKELSKHPDILMLDEPTNHLDLKNRRSLMRSLKSFYGTLIIVSHDVELLKNSIDKFWHIDNGKIAIFSGNYDDYMRDIKLKRNSIEIELARLDRQKKDMHQALMQEQHRAAKSKLKGQKSIDNRKWPTITSKAKALNAQETSGKKKLAIDQKKQYLQHQLKEMRLPEIILPKFSISSSDIGNASVLDITNGGAGYLEPILNNINLNLYAGDRLAIKGDNGSGKTTLIKAILAETQVTRTGDWYVTEDIGYLDQHYNNLDFDKTVFENMASIAPNWQPQEIRRHLNDFLFRKNEEVNTIAQNLSGGEKVKLSLALIAAKTPKLLILDEITNNLDLETRQHVIEVLKEYPGSVLVISHDEDFLEEIGIEDFYVIENGQLQL